MLTSGSIDHTALVVIRLISWTVNGLTSEVALTIVKVRDLGLEHFEKYPLFKVPERSAYQR